MGIMVYSLLWVMQDMCMYVYIYIYIIDRTMKPSHPQHESSKHSNEVIRAEVLFFCAPCGFRA